MTSTLTYDIVIATDCRLPAGNAASVADEIRAQAQAGYRTGLLHLPSPQLTGSEPFAPGLRDALDTGAAELVLSADKVEARLMTVRHPAVLVDPPAEVPKIDAEHVVLTVNQTPAGVRRKTSNYDVDHVHGVAERVLGRPPVWAPIGPRIRQELTAYADRVPIHAEDWTPVLDVSGWRVGRDRFVGDRPVIGRHTAEHWSKWPRHRIDVLEAYPDDPRYEVRILGSLETPGQILGRIPPNWSSLPFGSVPSREFLTGVDFFVYFHHQKLTEPFGRAIVEALATGAVAIVPRYLEPVFGDACLYGHPADVRRYVDRLYQDWDAFAAQSRAGVELVEQRFGANQHIDRVAALIGPPSNAAPTELGVSGPPVRERGTLVVDLTRGRRLDPMVSSIVRATVAERGPRLVALPAARAAELGSRVAVETFPRVLDDLPTADQRSYLRARLDGLVQAHRPARLMIVDDGHTAVRELTAGLEDRDTAVWHIQPSGTSDPEDDQLVHQIATLLPSGWSVSRLAGPQHTGPVPAPANPDDMWTRSLRTIRGGWHRLSHAARRRLLRWLTADLRTTGLDLVEVGDTQVTLPVRGSHATPSTVPVALIVVTDAYAEPEPSVQAIAERQLVAGTFRTAILAPPDWEPPASAAGLTIETLISETGWSGMYGAGWGEYVRQRIDEACRALGPTTIVHAGGTAPAADELRLVLDILESARIRRSMDGQRPGTSGEQPGRP